MKKSKLHRKLLVAAVVFACLAISPINLHADCEDSLPNTPCPIWPDTPGIDLIPPGTFTIDLYDPINPDSFLFTLTASGPTIVQRYPYDQVAGYMRTEILELSGSGSSPHIGGPFQISLDPDSTSQGRIWPCDASCSFAFSCFEVSYIITTTLPPPMDELRSTIVMELQVGCDPATGWDPVADGTFRPPFGKEYKDPRKRPIYNKDGQLIRYALHKHELPEPEPSIPTLTEWVLIVLALSVAGFFIWQLKRRRKAVNVRI